MLKHMLLVTCYTLFLGCATHQAIKQADHPNWRLAKQPTLIGSSRLVAKSHVSDGSDRAQNGKRRFAGPIGAQGITYKGFQYIIYYTDKSIGGHGDLYAEVIVARRKITDGFQWERSRIPVYKVTSNDVHNRQSIGISKGDGTIHISFDHHNLTNINYAHTAPGVADQPESIIWDDSVFSHKPNLGFPRDAVDRVTYPTFHAFPGGNLLMYYRNGGTVGGEMQIARYDAKQKEWTYLRQISTRSGLFKDNVRGNTETSDRGPYTAGGPKIDDDGRIYIAWIYRERPLNCNPNSSFSGRDCNHGLYFAYSEDEGMTWKNTFGEQLIDASKGERISVATPGSEVQSIPTTLKPSNVAINSALDNKTGEYHVMIEHQTTPNGPSKVHHYVRRTKGTWDKKISSFAASDVTMRFLGDKLFAFAGREEATIYVASRESAFSDWRKISTPKVPTGAHMSTQETISGGYASWDLSRLEEGFASVIWQKASEDFKPTPIYTYDFQLKELDLFD